jgi:hypothetical protein
MGFLALVDPAAFGQTGSAIHLGWPGWVVVGILVLVVVQLVRKRQDVIELASHLREPFIRPLEDNPNFDGAYGSLAACPPASITRFGLSFVWWPAGLLVLGILFTLSDSFFVVDAILARFDVGWQTGVFFAADTAIAVVSFCTGARKLSTWRLAASVHKSATTGYAA